MTYIITDETTQIKIVASNGVEWNIDKDDCLVLKVPAKTKDNTTTKDKLYIGNDGQWPLQLFYDEVTVDGNTPSDIDDFEDMVNAILQNNGSGGSADLEDTITRVQAVALLDNGGADIELGKTYFINDIGATIPELQFIKLTPAYGKDSGDTIKVFSPNAEAYITALATYVPCTYDVGTNKINVMLETVFRVTQTGTSDPTLEVMKNDLTGVTFTAGYVDPGKYNIIPSISLSTLGIGPFNEVYVHMTGTQVIGEDVVNPFGLVSGFYDELNDTMRLGSQVVDFGTNALVPTDGIFNGIPIYLICILSN